MIEIEIDGKKIEVKEGSMVIEAADQAGIKIPRFCYHKKLSIAANCRMCLVDVAKAPKPLPACATPVAAGMSVSTHSKAALEAQKSVMEFLLINHPLDCPICDQGGECELQDVAMGYGRDISRFTERKRSVEDKNIGSLIATDMTRCIHCTRCVRFGDEIAGVRELGVTHRGEHMEIGTYVEHHLQSEMSGNVIDLCPVGALTSKPFRFRARAWELEQQSSISPHDCIGSNLHVHTRNNKVMRVVPKENEKINETWISDRDRFSYEGLQAEDRILAPMIKSKGEWITTDWTTALTFAVSGLEKVKNGLSASQIGAMLSPSSTTEECYLLQQLMRKMGSANIDFRIHQDDFDETHQAKLYLGSTLSLAELEKQRCILLIGSNVRYEQPIAHHRLRKASLAGANLMSLNPVDFDLRFKQQHKLIVSPDDMVNALAGIVKSLYSAGSHKDEELEKYLQTIEPHSKAEVIANQLLEGKETALVIGALAINHPQASTLIMLAEYITKHINARILYLTEGANSRGAWLAGAVPTVHLTETVQANHGLNAKEMWHNKLKAYVLFGIEPELDCSCPAVAKEALAAAEFVVALSAFKGKLTDYADVLLPIVPFTETSGSFFNVEGQCQSFAGVVSPLGEARPGWKVLRVLGNLFHLDGFQYNSSQDVFNELKDKLAIMQQPLSLSLAKQIPIINTNKSSQVFPEFYMIAEWPIYRIDSLVRRSYPLQVSGASEKPVSRINAKMANLLSIQVNQQITLQQENGMKIELPLLIDDRIPDECVYVPFGFYETDNFNKSFGKVVIIPLQQ